MSDQYFNSSGDAEKAISILTKSLPTYRQAYSDRTAWLMAVFSELSYKKFNPLFQAATNDENHEATEYIEHYFLKQIRRLVGEKNKAALSALIEKVAYDHQNEQRILESNIREFQFKLVKTFDNKGTQAILVTNNLYLVLAFRGTETDSLRDIKASSSATTQQCANNSKGLVHSGFIKAFNHIRRDIEIELKRHINKPLFITGHSLGGALATVATKYLQYESGIAACYTFGSPRVGNDYWINGIKTPIHRVVNAADCVTLLPQGDVTISVVSFFFRFIPIIGDKIFQWLSQKFGGYIHAGNMRYLTNCKAGAYETVKVLYSVSFTYRAKALLWKSFPFKRLMTDHAISVYSKKLMVIAFKRNCQE